MDDVLVSELDSVIMLVSGPRSVLTGLGRARRVCVDSEVIVEMDVREQKVGSRRGTVGA